MNKKTYAIILLLILLVSSCSASLTKSSFLSKAMFLKQNITLEMFSPTSLQSNSFFRKYLPLSNPTRH